MKVRCFGCDALIEAHDADAVADAFVAHGRENHTWSYPEEAIRNYARNYAEATERLTGGTERLSEIGEVTVHPVTEDRVDDWLRFFDHDAFAGNPDWASCYCLEPHVPATPEQPERAWRERRSDHGRATSGRHDLRVSRVRRRPARGLGQRLIAFRLRPLPTCRSRRTRAAIRDRSLVLRHRTTVPTARDRLSTARSRDRGRLRPRCIVDRGISPTTNPKGATQAISAARGPCTTHADSSRSRCGNMTP